jgi:hypothetical protein
MNNEEETDEQIEYRRKMEDTFREKKREWALKDINIFSGSCL